MWTLKCDAIFKISICFYLVCRRTDNDLFCEVLKKDNAFEGAVVDCMNDCFSSACLDAKNVVSTFLKISYADSISI